MMKTILFILVLIGSLAVAEEGRRRRSRGEGDVRIRVPFVGVDVNTDGSVGVHAPGVDVHSSDNGVGVRAPGVRFRTFDVDDDELGMIFEVPANAKIFLDDSSTTGTGTTRPFKMGNLKKKTRYSYQIRLEYQHHGKDRSFSTKLFVRTGKVTKVNLQLDGAGNASISSIEE